ncbi:ASCH domain-containing protein [Streptococcus castoreus]|uniref:ASCH domain-containing protein n=1 Tax=Streptococcus castoreus TaxID=254786 RepID=UPI00041A9951|nr:ASCH domain-containing protein [Streptococcus castoreus]
MQHVMMLTPGPFAMIATGIKTIELRLNDEKRQKVQIGDTITFIRTDDSSQVLRTTVVKLHYFDDFDQLYQSLPLEKCGYREEELETAHPEDMERYYCREQQVQYGVVGIELSVL